MRVKLTQDWRRWKEGKVLTGAAARQAVEEKAGKPTGGKPAAPKKADKE